jgi:L-seryl-tRNA(Ser) seleniumtransferase
MMSQPLAEIERRALAWQAVLGRGEVIEGESTVGGGSLPGETLPTKLLALRVKSPNAAAAKLRGLPIPIIARVAENQLLCDPRTVMADEEPALLDGLRVL